MSRRVVMEIGLCRSTRTGSAPRAELRRHFPVAAIRSGATVLDKVRYVCNRDERDERAPPQNARLGRDHATLPARIPYAMRKLAAPEPVLSPKLGHAVGCGGGAWAAVRVCSRRGLATWVTVVVLEAKLTWRS